MSNNLLPYAAASLSELRSKFLLEFLLGRSRSDLDLDPVLDPDPGARNPLEIALALPYRLLVII